MMRCSLHDTELTTLGYDHNPGDPVCEDCLTGLPPISTPDDETDEAGARFDEEDEASVCL